VRPRTPPTPRHAPNFEDYTPVRRSTRLKRENKEPASVQTGSTLSPPPSSPLAPSPPSKLLKKKAKKASFALDDLPEKSTAKGKKKVVIEGEEDNGERTKTRPTLINASGLGLLTPAKTPRKRRFAPEEIAPAASGGLFGTRQSRGTTSLSTPRRKSRSAGTLDIEEEEEPSIEIFTDTDARKPKLDIDPDNPFITKPGEETRSSKRKRQRQVDKVKNRLGEDVGRTDGMVYMFRGKRVFKRFDNIPDREDRAATADEGEDDHGLNPTKIKPRLLFPSVSKPEAENNSKHKRVSKEVDRNDEEDEEAETDIDGLIQASPSGIVIPENKRSNKKRPAVSRMTPESDDDVQIQIPSFKSKLDREKRLSGSKALFDEGEDNPFDDPAESPSADHDDGVTQRRGIKRSLETALNTPQSIGRKRMRRALFQ